TTPVSPSTDALVVLLTANGALDVSFNGTGWRSYDFGGSDEQFFGVARAPSGNWVAAVGYTSNGGEGDEDATVLILPLAGGSEVAQAVPLAVGADDRFWSVAFDAQERIYAAGFVTEAGDSRMVVARFTTAGVLDASFGTGGIVTLNVQEAGTAEAARGLVLQADGKIVIVGAVEAASTQ
ncbi:MAG TPA: delta-60 repeat domain-containing protein, partial [Candidatus Tectomicrobia bacterium]